MKLAKETTTHATAYIVLMSVEAYVTKTVFCWIYYERLMVSPTFISGTLCSDKSCCDIYECQNEPGLRLN